MENGFLPKLMKSIAAENTYILIWAIFLAAVLAALIIAVRKKLPPEQNKKLMIVRVLYEVFQTGISIFPLLGMFGTVKALLNMDFTNDLAGAQLRFFDALTSTAWGIIFAIIFKIVNAVLAPFAEQLLEPPHRAPRPEGRSKRNPE